MDNQNNELMQDGEPITTRQLFEEAASQLSKEQVLNLLIKYADQTSDMRNIKEAMLTILTKIGFIDASGNFREKPNVSSIISMFTNPKKLMSDFGFLGELRPLVEKYKDL